MTTKEMEKKAQKFADYLNHYDYINNEGILVALQIKTADVMVLHSDYEYCGCILRVEKDGYEFFVDTLFCEVRCEFAEPITCELASHAAHNINYEVKEYKRYRKLLAL